MDRAKNIKDPMYVPLPSILDDMPNHYSIQIRDLVNFLGVSDSTLYRWVTSGRLPQPHAQKDHPREEPSEKKKAFSRFSITGRGRDRMTWALGELREWNEQFAK